MELEQIAKALGHKYISTTFDIYCGIMDAMGEIRDFVEGNVDPVSIVIGSGVKS